jgi:transcriptional regulator GlxA family with amidase domain
MHPAHRIVIVMFPQAQMLDVAGPLDVFSTANACQREAGKPAPYEIALAAPQAGPVMTSSGIALLATHSLDDPDLQADTLLIAGGAGARLAVRDRAVIDALSALCARVPRIGSICTGLFPLAATGLIDNTRATTHWAHFDEFAALFPSVQLDPHALFISEGNCHSSAGITAGIDYSLSLVETDLGRRLALEVARNLVVFLKRPGGQAQFSAPLAAETAAEDPDRFASLTQWINQNLAGDLSVELLAERVAMSPRNFARRFVEAMKIAPAKYVEKMRVDAARRSLTDGDLSIARIAARCGFASAEAMRLAFKRHLDTAPNDFRARFRSSNPGQRRSNEKGVADPAVF